MISLEEESQPKNIAKPTNVQTLVSPPRGVQALVKLCTAYERLQVSVCVNVSPSSLFIHVQVACLGDLTCHINIILLLLYKEPTLQYIQIYFPSGVYTR